MGVFLFGEIQDGSGLSAVAAPLDHQGIVLRDLFPGLQEFFDLALKHRIPLSFP